MNTPTPTDDPSDMTALVTAVGVAGLLALVGYTSAGKVQTLFIPQYFRPHHPLAVLLGEDGFCRLIAALGGSTITLPSPSGRIRSGQRLRQARDALLKGESKAAIADRLGITERRVHQIAYCLGYLKCSFNNTASSLEDVVDAGTVKKARREAGLAKEADG